MGKKGLGKFERDLDLLLARLKEGADEETGRKLEGQRNRLIQLHKDNVVKINHSVMELVCAKHLILKGYEVTVEHPLAGNLVCDLYGIRGMGTTILEVETGFVPPEDALYPITYRRARIASKIARYSAHAHKFGLATLTHHILQIPSVFLKPPRERSQEDLREVKGTCDRYYKNPPISLKELRYGLLHTVCLIDVDGGEVREFDPGVYSERYPLINPKFTTLNEVREAR